MRGALSLIGLLLLGGVPVQGQEPLPPGAIARLGSTRLRVTGPVVGARFLDGGKKLLVRVHQPPPPPSVIDGGKGAFYLFDMASGFEQGRLAWELNGFLQHWTSNGRVADSIGFPHWSVSADGTRLATVDHWGQLLVRELATGKAVAEFQDKGRDLSFVQFTPDGKRVAAVTAPWNEEPKKDGKPAVFIRLWDLESRKEIRTFVPPAGATEAFQAHWFMFSPDAAFLAATGYEAGKAGIVRVWDTAGKDAPWLVPGATAKRDRTRAIAIAPDSKTLAAVADGRLKLWDLWRRAEVKDLADFADRCATLDFSPDGKRLLAGTGKEAGERLRLWDLASGAEITLPLRPCRAYVFSDDGRSLVLADEERLVVCDAATGKARVSVYFRIPRVSDERLEHAFYKARQGMAWPFALTPDGKMLVMGDGPGQLRRFDATSTGEEIHPPGTPMTPATALAFAPDGKKLLAAGKGKVVLHDLQGKAEPLTLETPRPVARKRNDRPTANHLAISGDGRRIAGGWDDGVVCVWDAATGKLLWQRNGHEWSVTSLAFATGDRALVSTGYADGAMHWWNVADGKPLRTFAVDADKEPDEWRRSLLPAPRPWSVFCKDGDRVLEYELASGKVRRVLTVPGYLETASPDGRSFLTALSAAYYLIDHDSGKLQRSLAWAGKQQVRLHIYSRARFSPDSRLIAGVAGEHVVRVWDRDSGTVLTEFAGHHGGALAVAFAPDGKSIASSAGDGTIMLWQTPPDPGPAPRMPLPAASKIGAGARDSDGNRLPDGARARFGSRRFQHAAPVDSLRWTADGKSILAQTVSPERGGIWIDLSLWDVGTGARRREMEVTQEETGRFSGPPPAPYWWEVSRDGHYLLTWNTVLGRKKEGLSPLRVYDIATEKVVFERASREGQAHGARFAWDCKSILDIDSMERIDVATGKAQKLPGPMRVSLYDSWFSPDRRFLLAKDAEPRPELWRLDRPGNPVRLPHKLGLFGVVAFAPDGRQMAMVTEETDDSKTRLVVMDTASGKVAKDLGEIGFAASRLLYAPDGKQLAAVFPVPRGMMSNEREPECRDTVRRWDLVTGKELPPIKTCDDVVVHFSPDSRTLAIACGEFVRLLDAATGRERHRVAFAQPVVVPRDPFNSVYRRIGDVLAFSPDSAKLAVAVGRTVRIMDVATGKEIGPAPISQALFSVSAANHGRYLAACTLGHVDVWDGVKRSLAFRIDRSQVACTGVALNADGSRLAVAGSDGVITLFEVPSGKQLRELQFHTAPVTSLTFAPDAGTLMSLDCSGTAAAWDIGTGARLRSHPVPGVAIEGSWEVIAGSHGEPIIVNEKGGGIELAGWPALAGHADLLQRKEGARITTLVAEQVESFRGTSSWRPTAIARNARMLAVPQWLQGAAATEHLVRLIDPVRGKEVRSVITALDIACCRFSPDGTWLAISGDKGIELWHTATGTAAASCHGHRGKVRAIAFSPDGGTLISAGVDGTLVAWDVTTLLANTASRSPDRGASP